MKYKSLTDEFLELKFPETCFLYFKKKKKKKKKLCGDESVFVN